MWFNGWERDSTRAVEIAPGSNILARTAPLQQIGGFDETLKLYFTEDDLCRRLLTQGEIHFVAEAQLIHEESASVNQVRRLASQIYFEDMLRYTAKYDGAARALLLRALLWPTRQALDLAQRLRGDRRSLLWRFVGVRMLS
jgi:GT2 family glycosyltransferase